jgi:uncharacterized membrane-anchored protein YhcB (DUF1043 family)
VVETGALWAAVLGALVVGIGLGALLSRGAARRQTVRVRELEEQLHAAESDHKRYRGEVAEHFGETSRRLRDLTLQYKSVYEHLADGARTLCPERAIEIAPSLADALPLAASAGAVAHSDATHEDAADDAQLDLELDAAPEHWTDARDEADDLGPLLDEDVPPPPAAESKSA